MNIVENWIKKIRRAVIEKMARSGLSQSEAGELSGTSRVQMNRILKGNESVGLNKMVRIADSIGLKLELRISDRKKKGLR